MTAFPETIAFMEGLGGPEMVLIFVVILVLFGGQKLPEFARGLGKSMREFKKAAAGVEEEFKRAMEDDEKKKIATAALPPPAPTPPTPPPVPATNPNPDGLPLEALSPADAAAAVAWEAANTVTPPSADAVPAAPLIPLGTEASTPAASTAEDKPAVPAPAAPPAPAPAPVPSARIRDDYA